MPTLSLEGADLYYTRVGSGVPCLVLHGGLGSDHTYLLNSIGEIDGLELIYFDQRANGRSTGEPSTLTFEQLCLDVDALRSHLGHEQIAILGQSFGGHVGLEYALRFPERCSALVVANSSGEFRPDDDFGGRMLAKNPELTDKIPPEPTDDEGMRRYLTAIAPAYYYQFDKELNDRVYKDTIFRVATAARSSQLLLDGWTVLPRASQIKAPTLILCGRVDWLYPVSVQEVLAATIPGSRLVVLEKSGHCAFVEEREAFCQAVAEHLGATTAPVGVDATGS